MERLGLLLREARFAASIVDCVTSAALVTLDPRNSVSLNLNINYLAAMPAGEDCKIEASVLRLGGRISVLGCTLTRTSTGTVVAQGTHIKSLQPSPTPSSKL